MKCIVILLMVAAFKIDIKLYFFVNFYPYKNAFTKFISVYINLFLTFNSVSPNLESRRNMDVCRMVSSAVRLPAKTLWKEKRTSLT